MTDQMKNAAMIVVEEFAFDEATFMGLVQGSVQNKDGTIELKTDQVKAYESGMYPRSFTVDLKGKTVTKMVDAMGNEKIY